MHFVLIRPGFSLPLCRKRGRPGGGAGPAVQEGDHVEEVDRPRPPLPPPQPPRRGGREGRRTGGRWRGVMDQGPHHEPVLIAS